MGEKAMNKNDIAENVVQVADSIPGVKAATMGELKVTGLEVETATTTQTHDTAITTTSTVTCSPGEEPDGKGGCRKCPPDLVSTYGTEKCRACFNGFVPNENNTVCVEEMESCKPCSKLKMLLASSDEMSATDRECYQQCQAGDANENSYTFEIIGAVVGVLSLVASVGVATKWWGKSCASEEEDVEMQSVSPA